MCFKTRIRELRIEKGLTQQQLANKAGISRAFLAQLELQQRQPSIITLIKIAKALNVLMSDLLCLNYRNNMLKTL